MQQELFNQIAKLCLLHELNWKDDQTVKHSQNIRNLNTHNRVIDSDRVHSQSIVECDF